MEKQPLVVLVEDSPTQAIEVAATLKSLGFAVLTAQDGREGLDMVVEHRPVLVVLDVQLPKMNGYQVCHRLKRDPSTASIPVIMLTVADSSEETFAGLQAGANDYIPKDMFAADNLAATLKRLNLRGSDEHGKV